METDNRPAVDKVDEILEKLHNVQSENDERTRRNMFVKLMGSEGLGLIDESKHRQPKERYLP